MRKKIALLGICLMFMLSSLLTGAFAPIISQLQAAGTPSANGHYIETDAGSIQITNLPNKEYKVTSLISEALPSVVNGHYTLSRMVGKGALVGVSNASIYGGTIGSSVLDFSNPCTEKFKLPGMYIFKFYTPDQFAQNDGGVFTGKSVHDYTITISSSVYTIELPTNSEDIIPNITVPNPSKSNPRHDDYVKPGEDGHVAPIVPIVLPLPESLYDTEGRDLLGLGGDEETRREAIEALQEIYGTGSIESLGAVGVGDTIANAAAAETDEKDELLRDLVYADMRIAFYGNNNTEYSRDTEETYTLLQTGIKDKEWRTFVPVNQSSNYRAEYYFQHKEGNIDVSAYLSTSKITVEQPNVSQTLVDNIKTEILFNKNPSMSYKLESSNLRVGTETSLPVPSMTVSADSEILFDNIGTISNYTYINVLYSKDGKNLKYLDKNGEVTDSTAEADIMKITDFKFTPKSIGTYRLEYYTTTLFNYGKNNHSPKPSTSGRYLKYTPVDDLVIERNTQTPEYKWTAPYEYKHADGGSGEVLGMIFDSNEVTKYEDAEDYSKYLPSSKTVIGKGEYLFIPAVLGNSNFTESDDLEYQLVLYRYEDNIRDDTNRIRWSSKDINPVWDHTQPFAESDESPNGLHFPSRLSFDSTDLLGSTIAVSGNKWSGKTVAGKYDLTVRVTDPHNNYTAQNTYTFEVKDTYTTSRPSFTSSLKLGQQEYYEKDAVKFNVVNVTDSYTTDANIEVKYYVSVNNGTDIGTGDAIEIKNDSKYKGMSIKNGVVSFELNMKNPAGAYVLTELGNTESLTFRVYAVARNYHALVGGIDGIELGDWIGTALTNFNQEVEAGDPDARQLDIDNACLASTHADALPYIAASYDSVSIFKMSFGEAARITEGGSNEFTWDNYLDDQDTSHGKKIAIPSLTFAYPVSLDSSKPNNLQSSISYEIIDQKTGTSLGATSLDADGRTIGGGWSGVIGEIGVNSVTLGEYAYDSVNDIRIGFNTQRYFETSKVGLHWVVVKVTNSGGNVGIFVGVVNIAGTPWYDYRLISDSNTMKIGESKSLPTVEVTINGEIYVSGTLSTTLGYIVTEKNVSGGVADGRQAKVGVCSITYGSDNGTAVAMDRNSFAPTSQGTYTFTYNIYIADQCEGGEDYLPSVSTSNPISFEITHTITVTNIESSDLILDLDTRGYEAAEKDAIDINTPGFVPTEINKYNFFSQMIADKAEGMDNTLEMSSDQLYNALVPVNSDPAEFTAETSWQYGKIYLPNEQPNLKSNVMGLGADFFNNADTFITVTNSSNSKVLLDTRSGSSTLGQFDDQVSNEGMYYFIPQGQLIPQYSQEPTSLAEAYQYAVKKDEWEPVNKDVKVDAQYVVTYTLSYKGLIITKTYNIAIGDTGQPKLQYINTSSSSTDIFEKIYRVGDKMSFVFGVSDSDKLFNISGTKDNSYFWDTDPDTGEYYFQNTQENKNIYISIITPTKTLKVGEDDFEIIIDPNTHAETYSFKFAEAGTYTIQFRIYSKTGVPGTKEFYVTVDEKKPATQIAPEEVMGIILIIISSGLLLGIVVYFIRTGQSTRFSTKRGAKKPKEDKPDVV